MTLTHDDFDAAVRAFDVFDPALADRDLHPFFARLREERPIARTDAAGGIWMISRYDDAVFVLQNPEIFSSAAPLWPFVETDDQSIPFTTDPPAHTKYRQILAPMFSPQRVAAMEPFIRDTARSLAQQIRHRGECDFIDDYARPIPSRTFLRNFDVPDEWLDDLVDATQAAFTPPENEDDMARLYDGGERVAAFYRQLIAQRRAEGASGSDVVSDLLRAEYEGRALDEPELLSMLNLLTAASLDTTTTTLANFVEWLARNPDRRDELVAEPAKLPGAIEELFRYDQLNFNGRIVRQPIELRGQQLQPGDRVMILFPSTGRDADAYPDPETVDFDRSPNRHLALGAGPHRCLGLHLARLTLRVELEEWHAAVPRYSVKPGTRPRRRVMVLAGVTSLELVTR